MSRTSTTVSSQKRMALAYTNALGISLVDVLADIETQLEQADRILDRVQPAHSGRIRLMWIARKSRGWLNERNPVPVSWSRNKLSGRWSALKLPVKGLVARAKHGGEFYDRRADTRKAVEALAMLLAIHARVRRSLTAFDQAWCMSRPHVTADLDQSALRLVALQQNE